MSTAKEKIAISVVVFEDAEAWLRENLHLMSVDRVCAVRRTGPLDLDGITHYKDFSDEGDGTEKDCTLEDHVRALQKLCEMVGVNLFVGGIKSPRHLVDPCNWDVTVNDAYMQLVLLGEVVYG